MLEKKESEGGGKLESLEKGLQIIKSYREIEKLPSHQTCREEQLIQVELDPIKSVWRGLAAEKRGDFSRNLKYTDFQDRHLSVSVSFKSIT